jgi:hypothetical protein
MPGLEWRRSKEDVEGGQVAETGKKQKLESDPEDMQIPRAACL